jgi:hypothetical protein
MKKANVKSRIKKEDLNPVFHFKDKAEDDKILTPQIIKQALKTGKVELVGKNLKYSKNFFLENRLIFDALDKLIRIILMIYYRLII